MFVKKKVWYNEKEVRAAKSALLISPGEWKKFYKPW